jgi:uncharacterized coiled-coil protein SlyX
VTVGSDRFELIEFEHLEEVTDTALLRISARSPRAAAGPLTLALGNGIGERRYPQLPERPAPPGLLRARFSVPPRQLARTTQFALLFADGSSTRLPAPVRPRSHTPAAPAAPAAQAVRATDTDKAQIEQLRRDYETQLAQAAARLEMLEQGLAHRGATIELLRSELAKAQDEATTAQAQAETLFARLGAERAQHDAVLAIVRHEEP